MPKKKDKIKTNIEHKLVINGREMTFHFHIDYKKNAKGTIERDRFGNPIIDRYYYRPTEYELSQCSKLKPMRSKSLAKILDSIKDAAEIYNPLNQLFNDALRQYLKEVKKCGSNPVRASTYANIEITVDRYIAPYFEGLYVREVNDSHCRKMLNDLLNAGYSKSVIDKAYLYLHEFLNHLAWHGVCKNWLDIVPRPKPETIANKREELGKKGKARHYLNDSEIKQIRAVLYAGYDIPQVSKTGKKYNIHKSFSQPEVFDLLLTTGLRVGELLALKYSDWNQDEKTLNISKDRVTYIDRSGDENVIVTEDTRPKTPTSRTTLSLSDEANSLIASMRDKEPEKNKYCGYIVHTKDDKRNPLTVRAFQHRFERIIEAAGLDNISPHDLRHTYASILHEKTNNDIHLISKKLRHKDPTTTANIYVDLREDKEREFDENIKILADL